MPVLTSDLRRQLENVIIEARDKAEEAAASALRKFGVDAAKPHDHFGPKEKAFRNRLRARGRQAGDKRETNGSQEITQLTQELAYEYWHRMLFARFLAENHLLLHPDSVPVSLADCNELAAGEGLANGFLVAAKYASRMLPQIFRTDDVLLEIEFPANDRIPLEKLLASLPAQTYTADDSLGWVYQFWQSKRKDEVNAKGDKIDARSISAVTQLFTEHYMVLFLLHNTIGAWHAGKVLAANPKLAETAASEDELRKAVALDTAGGYSFDYLRFVREASPSPGTPGEGRGEGLWRPAAGTFSGWPKAAAELKMLDPCCGSGHFLVAGFELLVRLRMAEESLDLAAAIDAVLRDNLHGLELDARCTQIAAFNLAIAAWKLGGYRPLPAIQIACSGLAPQAKKEQWTALADRANLPPLGRVQIQNALLDLYDLFQQAPMLGSLVDVQQSRGSLVMADWATVAPTVLRALAFEKGDEDERADAVTARGLLDAARILAGPQPVDPCAADVSGVGYTLVITNVPYLGRGKQDSILQAWAEEHEPDAKADLATMFISRGFNWLAKGGSVAVVSPQNWSFLGSYRRFREELIKRREWNIFAKLGEEAWWAFGIRGPRTALVVLTEQAPMADHVFVGIDVSTVRGQKVIQMEEKAELLSGRAPLAVVGQSVQTLNPDCTIVFEKASELKLLSEYAESLQGAATLDIERFRLLFVELPTLGNWKLHQSTPSGKHFCGGMHYISASREVGTPFVEVANALAAESRAGAPWAGKKAWGRSGVACGWMNVLPVSHYLGAVFDNSIAAIIPRNLNNLPAIWAYLSSPDYLKDVRKINQKPQVANATLVKVPFDLAHWQSVAADNYPNGLPEPESDDPTQWLFHGRPEESEQPLEVAVARLVGYQWPAELDEKMRLSERALGLVKRCDELLKFADDDGILPIPAMRGENPLTERVTELLAAAYGKDWSPTVLQKLLADADMKAGASLDDWLRNAFFEQHCKLFHHRPFIWHIWDGRKDGFNVLVNYHRLDHKRLESLTHAYLGDWISTQESDNRAGKPGADLRLEAAQKLQKKLIAILIGEKPYDIFVRWKKLEEQPIGWHPDLNDGVRMNIRPFVEADVLRRTPNIKWTKDRGKDPETAPWFKKFGGERINDHHLSLEEKRKAREEAKGAKISAESPNLNESNAPTPQALAEEIFAVLKAREQPSPWELLERLERRFGIKARWSASKACRLVSELPEVTGAQRDYLRDLLEGEEWGMALRGEKRPAKAIESTIDAMLRDSVAYRTSEAFQEMVRFMANFRDYAPFNNMLVRLQRPSCSFYATQRDWQSRFGRTIKQDSKPIIILAPMHPVMLVYELDSTEGPELPASLLKFASFEGDWDRKRLTLTIENATIRDLIQIDTVSLSSTHGGFATLGLSTNGKKMRIALHDQLNDPSRYGVLLHELAHIYLGHLGGDADGWWPARGDLEHHAMEIEAEAVAYIVSSRAGLSGASAEYVSSYTKGGPIPPSVSLDLVAKVAGRLEEMGSHKMTARKPKKPATAKPELFHA